MAGNRTRPRAEAAAAHKRPEPPKSKTAGNGKADQEWMQVQLDAGLLWEYEGWDNPTVSTPYSARWQWQELAEDVDLQFFEDRRYGKRTTKCSADVPIRDEVGTYIVDLEGEPIRRPCLRRPLRGANVCQTHGGATEHIRRKAAQRLAEAANKSATVLIRMTDPTDELGHPVDQKVRVRAAESILDRVGIKGGVEVEISTPGYKRVMDKMFNDEELDDDGDE